MNKTLSIQDSKILEKEIDTILKSLENFTEQGISIPVGFRVQLGVMKGYVTALSEVADYYANKDTTEVKLTDSVNNELLEDAMIPPSAKLVK